MSNKLDLKFLPRVGRTLVAVTKDDGGLGVDIVGISAEIACSCHTTADLTNAINNTNTLIGKLVAAGAETAAPNSLAYRQLNVAREYVRQLGLAYKPYQLESELYTVKNQATELRRTNTNLVAQNQKLQDELAAAPLDALARAYLALQTEINPMITDARQAAIDAMLTAYPALTLEMVEARAAELAPEPKTNSAAVPNKETAEAIPA